MSRTVGNCSWRAEKPQGHSKVPETTKTFPLVKRKIMKTIVWTKRYALSPEAGFSGLFFDPPLK
ncbi:MAG: hypothetical protein AB1715_03260 [Acidobacteriota bacterium]